MWRDPSGIISLGRAIPPRALAQGNNSRWIPTERAIIVLLYRNKTNQIYTFRLVSSLFRLGPRDQMLTERSHLAQKTDEINCP